MMTSRLIILVLLTPLIMALLAACQSSTTPPVITPTVMPDSYSAIPGGISDDTIVLGVSAAFQGSSASLGTELYRGAQAYFTYINENGGINGRQIELRVYNDGYNPDPAVQNTVSLVEKDDVFLLFNYVGTPTVTRVLPLLAHYRDRSMYMFFPFTGAEPQRTPPYDELAFNLRASYRQEISGLMDNLVAAGHSRIAILYQADAYGRSGWDGITRALAKHNLDIVGEATYTRGTNFEASFSEQVDILKASNPDAILEVGSYQACAGFIRDAREEGLDIPILNVSFVGTESLLALLQQAEQENGQDYTSNLINSQVVPHYQKTELPAVNEYQTLMKKYDPSPPAGLTETGYQAPSFSFVSFEGFLNAKLLVEILDRLGPNPTREQIPVTVESIQNFDLGIDAPVSFGPDQHQGSNTVYYTTVKDNQIVPLEIWEEWNQ